MKPEVFEFQEKKIIGIGNIESPINPGEVWPIFFSRIQEINGRKNTPETLGVIKRNEPGYVAGIEVEQLI